MVGTADSSALNYRRRRPAYASRDLGAAEEIVNVLSQA